MEVMSSSACSPFLRIQTEDLSGQGRWSKQDPPGLDQEIIYICAHCTSKHFFEANIGLTKELGLPTKQRNLKDSAVPPLLDTDVCQCKSWVNGMGSRIYLLSRF